MFKIIYQNGSNSEVSFYQDRQRYERAWSEFHRFFNTSTSKGLILKASVYKDGVWREMISLKNNNDDRKY